MIESFSIQNFKAFGARQTIPLKKITLLFGANSAGKSSLLQSLLLLKQSILEAEDTQAALLPKGSLIDLGSVSEMSFRHGEDPISFGFSLTLPTARRGLVFGSPISGSFTFSQSDRRGLTVSKFTLDEDGEPVLQLSPVERRRVTSESVLERRAVRFRGELLNPQARIVSDAFNAYMARIQPLLHSRETSQQNWFRLRASRTMPLFASLLDDHWREQSFATPADMAAAIEKQIAARIERLRTYDRDEFTSDLAAALAKTDILGFGIRLRGPREDAPNNRGSNIATELDFTTAITQFTRTLSSEVGRIGYVGPYRATPERLYIFLGIDPRDVGRAGQNLPHLLYRRPDLVKKLNDWFSRMGVGYQLDIRKARSADIEGVFSLRMHDPTIKESVSWVDVGFGISQLLPILVQALIPESRLILVEQPELHLHPRLQAEFGSILAEATRLDGANRFLVETHSEHLILRLQRLIRRGEISADDVGVVHVRRSSEGSIAKVLRMDESGEFLDRWPEGFFEEDFVERFSD